MIKPPQIIKRPRRRNRREQQIRLREQNAGGEEFAIGPPWGVWIFCVWNIHNNQPAMAIDSQLFFWFRRY
jgi:hypothetical protein